MAVPRAEDEQPVLRLMPPAAGSPTEPTCYKSPAKPTMKRECTRVGRVSSYEQLIQLGDDAGQLEEVLGARVGARVLRADRGRDSFCSEEP